MKDTTCKLCARKQLAHNGNKGYRCKRHTKNVTMTTTRLYTEEFLAQEKKRSFDEGRVAGVTGETSDGYHTFNELYEFRKLYNAALFNEWSKQGLYNVHKSTKHHDGEECFGGGWFIVMATLPTGQISNHYEYKDWGLFQCDVRHKADEWDGHTAQDVLQRLRLLSQSTTPPEEGAV